MACNNPILFKTKKGDYVRIPCGYCIQCRIDKKRAWSDRLRFDLQHAARQGFSSSFVTLTYDNDHIPANASVSVQDSQKFIKRLRRSLDYHKVSLPTMRSSCRSTFHYFYVAEYGGKIGRPHYHAVLIGLAHDECYNYICHAWPFGFIQCNPLLAGGIEYCIKYLDKQLSAKKEKEFYAQRNLNPPFMLCSQGVGKDYFFNNLDRLQADGFYLSKAKKVPLPYYYRKLLHTPLPNLSREVLPPDEDLLKRISSEKSLVAKERLHGSAIDDSYIKDMEYNYSTLTGSNSTVRDIVDQIEV